VNLDPAQVTDLNSNRVGRRVVETLVTFPEEKTEVVPGLAESWTISKDGLQYTFKLRKGISFHDNTPFNAAAVKFSIERQINPDHQANKIGKYLYRQAQKILIDDAPWIFIDHEVQIAALSKRVQGFKLHPSFDLRVETISLR
jgi:ABC-type transport system substrate-binding protein